MIQCYVYTPYIGVSRVFRCQLFIGCINQLIIRLRKEELDDACLDKRIPADFYADLMFREVDDGVEDGTPHMLESYIPEKILDGDTCYFRDAEKNARYTQQAS